MFRCRMESSVDVNYSQMIEGVHLFLNHFLPAEYAISQRGVLKSPAVIVDASLSPCGSISFCLVFSKPIC